MSLAESRFEESLARMGDPGAIVAIAGLALLVAAHLSCGGFVGFDISLDRDLRCHAAHGVGSAAVAGLYQEPAIGPHQRLGHADITAIRQHHVGPIAELLDDAENIVPTAAIEANDMIEQLMENFIQFEGIGDGFEQ